ncbi:MAG: LysM peptidoglycan-binding domain-containing protein [Lachnospiraceae bacterium]|nr:LysM peptidoglycan-binding domain-containing protein [Lachnospiraceae bacterium]
MRLRNVKNVLCIAAVSAAVALSGVPVSGPSMVVQAEETQMTALDDILQQMYLLYQSGDFASMYALDANDMTRTYAEFVKNSGADRYVISLDDNTKAMLYVSADGGYWWYFGQMVNNLRQGTGTTLLLNSNYYELFTGTYDADFPGGSGTYSIHWYNDGSGYDLSGTFQGMQVDGTYQVNAIWLEDGISYSSSLPITYTNSHFTSIGGGWELDEYYTYEDFQEYYFYNSSAGDGIYFTLDQDVNLTAVGMTPDGISGHWWGKNDISETFSSVFLGNAAAVPAPETTPATPETPTPDVSTPETTTPTPTTPAFPEQPSASDTYIVQRGDNLSRIAEKVYGDRTQWRKIYDANKDIIGKNYTIFANQTLVIPVS